MIYLPNKRIRPAVNGVDCSNAWIHTPDGQGGPPNPVSPIDPQSCTMMCWGYQKATSDCGFLGVGGDQYGTGNSYFYISYFGSWLLFANDGTSVTIGSGAANLNAWEFWALTGNGTVGTVYRVTNGSVVTATASGVVTGIVNEVTLGNDAEQDGSFQGLVAGFKMYNYPMALAEILQEMTQLAPVQPFGLVSYLPLRGPGSALFDEARPGYVWQLSGSSLGVSAIRPPVPETRKVKAFSYITQAQNTPNDIIFYSMDF